MEMPTPAPTRIRPVSSIGKFTDTPPMHAPATYADAAENRVHFRPNERVIGPAKKAATVAERKREEQNSVRIWLSNLQYWLTTTCFFISS